MMFLFTNTLYFIKLVTSNLKVSLFKLDFIWCGGEIPVHCSLPIQNFFLRSLGSTTEASGFQVPFEGFSKLQGLSGVQKFQIHKRVMLNDELPFARTSYNMLELPDYESKQILKEKLLLALKEAKELTAKKSRKEWRGRRVVSRS